MPHSLPPLPYDFGALEPHIDAKTMEIHHGKHHQTYVTKLNEALEKAPDLANKSLDELMRSLDKAPERTRAALDTVILEPEERRLILIWRKMAPIYGPMSMLKAVGVTSGALHQ